MNFARILHKTDEKSEISGKFKSTLLSEESFRFATNSFMYQKTTFQAEILSTKYVELR